MSTPRALAHLALACSASLVVASLAACVGADDDAPALTRLRAEPAGDHCAAGGRAVLGGPDRDGDGALADEEVATTDYLCAAAPVQPLLRSDELAPEAACADGGLALLVGADADGDGRLADAEIERRELVCHTAAARVLIQRDALAPGASCHLGGTTVAAGPDRDGDGAIATDEIVRTLDLCALASANVLTREDREPPGARCADGGSAIHAGLDDDLDGALDDAEIDTTHVVCDLLEIAQGDVVIDGATTAEQLARFARLRVILGALTINGGARVELPALEVINGGIVIGGDVQDVALPRLVSVNGDVRVTAASLVSLSLPALGRITGALSINAPALALTLPAVTTIGGDLQPRPVRSLEAPHLLTIGGELTLFGRVDALLLPALTSVRSRVMLNATLPRIDLSQLRSAQFLWMSGLAGDVSFPSLQGFADGGGLRFTADHVTSLSLPKLVMADYIAIDGERATLALTRLQVASTGFLPSVTIANAPALRVIELDSPSIESLELSALPALERLDAPTLTRVGRLDVQRTGLRTIDLPKLGDAGRLYIDHNAALTSISVDLLRTVRSISMEGNPRLASVAARAIAFPVEELRFVDNPELALFATVLTDVAVLRLSRTGFTDLQSFRTLTTLGALTLQANARLTSTAGLAGARLTRIQGAVVIDANPALKNVSGLEKLKVIGGELRIVNNAQLVSLAGFAVLRAVGATVDIATNQRLPAAERTRLLNQLK